MEKLKENSLDILEENINKMKQFFPEVFTEDKIDFNKLEQILGNYVEDQDERYNFTWNGKGKALRLSQTPSTGTLRPVKEESKNWDTTENLYIEGDNLEVLKLLQKSYHNKIKMIYIDPPYNTGKDFVYKDDYRDNIKNYLEYTGQLDEEGKKIGTNSETSGRYHTDWLNMMYPRLRLARNLLSDDGVIFISIDDNEVHNLRKICDEIFGEDNFVGKFVKQSKVGGGSDTKFIVKEHEYCVVYAKNINETDEMFINHDDEYLKRYKEEDENGRYFWDTFARPGLKNPIVYDIKAPDGTIITNGWIRSKDRFINDYKEGIIRIIQKDNGQWSVQFKQYLNDSGKKPRSMTMKFGGTIEGKNEIRGLFGNDKIFSYPKSSFFVKTIIDIMRDKNTLILDFFAGSSTTADAVMQLNAEDGGNRKFIMVQLPEPTDEKSEAYKEGYRNISDISKERIRRAGEKVLEENKDKEGIENLDIGFKMFKLDKSNIKEWNPDYNNLESTLTDMIDNFVLDRTEEDILYEIILKYGIDLTLPMEEHNVEGKRVFNVGMGALFICLDNNITLEVVEGIAKLKNKLAPEISRVVFKDNGFKDDSVKTNSVLILKRQGIDDVLSI